MKVSPKVAGLLFGLTTAFFMSATMSGILTLINQGFDASFFAKWGRSFGISLMVSLPLSLLVIPQLKKLFDGITQEPAAPTDKP